MILAGIEVLDGDDVYAKSSTCVPLERLRAYFVPSALTEALLKVAFTVVPARLTVPSKVPSRVVAAAHGRSCVIVNSNPVLGMMTSFCVLVAGLSITKLPRAESSVNG